MKRTTEPNDVSAYEDPVLAFLARVPTDDEPLTADDEHAIAEGWAAYHRGEAESATDAREQTIRRAQEKQDAPV